MADALRAVCGFKPAAQIGIGHRRQRMVLHAAFAEQPVADEEVALVDRAARRRERPGRRSCGRAPSRVHQRVDNGADIALGRRIEGGAVLEEELPAALALQPVAALQATGATASATGTVRDLQRDDPRLDARRRPPCRARRSTAITRIPPFASVLARSDEPVKSSPMQPSSIVWFLRRWRGSRRQGQCSPRQDRAGVPRRGRTGPLPSPAPSARASPVSGLPRAKAYGWRRHDVDDQRCAGSRSTGNGRVDSPFSCRPVWHCRRHRSGSRPAEPSRRPVAGKRHQGGPGARPGALRRVRSRRCARRPRPPAVRLPCKSTRLVRVRRLPLPRDAVSPGRAMRSWQFAWAVPLRLGRSTHR